MGRRAEPRRRRHRHDRGDGRAGRRRQRRPQHDARVVGEPDRSAVPDDAAARREPARSSCSSDRSCRARKANQLSAFMVARNDGDNYGKLVAVPGARSVARAVARVGPRRSSRPIRTSAAKFSLLDQRGSTVVRGDVQLIPIGNSIIYVRPIYVEGTGSVAVPALQLRRGHLRRAGGARHERRRRGRPPARRHDPAGRADRRPATGDGPTADTTPTTTTTPDTTPTTTAGPRSRRRTPRSRSCSREANQLFAAGERGAGRTRTSRPMPSDVKQAAGAGRAGATAGGAGLGADDDARCHRPTSTSTTTQRRAEDRPPRSPTPELRGVRRAGIVGGSGDCYYRGSVNSRRGRPTPGPMAGGSRQSESSRRRWPVAVQGIDLGKYKLGWHDTENERLQAQEGPERGDRPRDLVAQVRARVDDEVPPQRVEALRAQADARRGSRRTCRPSTSTTSTTTSSRPRVRSTTGTCSRKR